MSVRSLRAIPVEGELTIPYISLSMTPLERQKQLKGQYFFDCSCEYCLSSLTCGQPDMPATLKVGIPTKDILQLEQEADRLQALAADAPSSEEEAEILNKALKLFNPYKDVYPKWRSPWPTINYALMQVYLDLGHWLRAVAHALQLYFYISPVWYPQEWHPLRAVRTFVLLKIGLELGFQTSEGPNKEHFRQTLNRYDIDWPVVIAALRNEVDATIPIGFGLDSSFAAAVKPCLDDVPQQWQKVQKGAWDGQRRKLEMLANDLVGQ